MPLLRELFVYQLITLETSALVFLLSPTLRHLDLTFALDHGDNRRLAQDMTTSLFQTLPLMAPNLETIYYDLDIDLGYEDLESFVHLTRLKTLSISPKVTLDGHALGILSSIATLQVLSCHSTGLSNRSTFPRTQCIFQQLTELLLRGRLDHLPILMRPCQFPNLAQIKFHIDQPLSAVEPSEAFATICQCFNPASLTSFSLVVYHAHIAPHPYSLLHSLEPLLSFPNIESFHVTLPWIMPSVNDDDLARFGRAWLRLSSFSVWGHHPDSEILFEPEIMRPTLAGLVALARGCPQLNSFCVPRMDMNIVPEETVALPLGHGLRYLVVCDNVTLPSPESPAYSDAATILDRVFPSIDLKKAQLEGKSVEGWGDFLEFWGTVRRGREDESRMDY